MKRKNNNTEFNYNKKILLDLSINNKRKIKDYDIDKNNKIYKKIKYDNVCDDSDDYNPYSYDLCINYNNIDNIKNIDMNTYIK
jgi:hypothetical protein